MPHNPVKLTIPKETVLPDPVKLERFRLTPALGPKILFFSGGTALRRVSRELTNYTHNSIHIITPFDSGGSSAVLRKAFHMPAVGDVRNRLMALADQTLRGNPEVFNLFTHRFSKSKQQEELIKELNLMAGGKHSLVRPILDPMRKIIRNHLYRFLDEMKEDFDLRGASIGNLVLTAGYLDNRRQLDPVIFLFSKLVEVKGLVRPVVNKDLHLAAQLEDGEYITGQHNMTGKEVQPLSSPVERLWLVENLDDVQSVEVTIQNKMRDRILEAELICYPMGSFYTSLIANLLPKGVGRAIAANPCPKIFIPNTGHDPELLGHDIHTQVERLLFYLKKDDPSLRNEDVLNFLLVDRKNGVYPGKIDSSRLKSENIQIIDYPLITKTSTPLIDEKSLVPVLLSIT